MKQTFYSDVQITLTPLDDGNFMLTLHEATGDTSNIPLSPEAVEQLAEAAKPKSKVEVVPATALKGLS